MSCITYFSLPDTHFPLAEDSCLYPQVEQQPTVQDSSVTNSTVILTWSPAMLPSNCTQVVTSLAPLDYTVEYSPSGQETISVSSTTYSTYKETVGVDMRLGCWQSRICKGNARDFLLPEACP